MFEQCDARRETLVFSHYAYGDPQPVYARFHGEEGPTTEGEAITVYARCEREAGHSGLHLARGMQPWT